jgi:threonine dehydrogenase-like Zn-dependent dehydrogenase
MPEPEAGQGDVLVEVEVALAGASEAQAFKEGHARLPAGPTPFGREFCGIDVGTGRRVAAASSAPCGHCASCQAGREAMCRRPVELEGAFAELALVPARIAETNLHPVPSGLPAEVAALVDPLACCLHAVERAELRPGSIVAVLGAGPIGLMLCACAADAGGWPVAVGGRAERHALAAAFGARPGNPHDADVVLEAAGTDQARRDALELVQPGGTVLILGSLEPGELIPADGRRLRDEELTLRGASGHAPRHVRAALAFLASGAYPWERLVTHEMGLDGVAELLTDPPPACLKTAVRP